MDNVTRTLEYLTIVLIYAFLFSIHQMHGVVNARHRLTKYLKVNADVYDCIDFYKQPAFDHPLLANHSFHHEMRPSSTPVMRRKSRLNGVSFNDVEVGFKGVGCPVGTVPIRRVSEKNRLAERLHSGKYQSKYNTLSAEHPGTHYAVARTKIYADTVYYGGGANLSLWNPSVEKSQYSSGQIALRNGNDNIQVGWTVNPTLYGDNRTHLFIYTGAGPTTQCFNTYCPGFVQVNKDLPVDRVVDVVSKRGKDIYYIPLLVWKDPSNGNWWLRRGSDLTPVGFWPKNIFTGLSDGATVIEWGGQVSGPTDVPSAPMGAGMGYLTGDASYDAYCDTVSVVNEAHLILDALHLEKYTDTDNIYQVSDLGNGEKSFGTFVVYGGFGGALGN